MGQQKRRKQKNKPVDLPVSDNAEISETTIYPTIDVIFEEYANKFPWVLADGRLKWKHCVYWSIAEALRTIQFRFNAEQSVGVFVDFDREIQTYDQELQRARTEPRPELN